MTTPNRGYPLIDTAPGADGLNPLPHIHAFELAVDADVQSVADAAPTALNYVVASDGGDPPQPLHDGFGNFIYVPYTP